jgi:GT2 family glycosyltransferase
MKKEKITVIVPLDPKREPEVLESLKEQEESVKIIIEVGGNPSINRNKGIRKANTELIAFTNAHSFLPKDWSKKVIRYFQEYPEVDMIGGPQFTSASDSTFERISGYGFSSLFGAAHVRARYTALHVRKEADETMLTSANLICRKKVVNEVRFNEYLYPGEDPQFIADVKKAGFHIAYVPTIFVYQERRSTSKALAQQIFSYGKTRREKESILETLKRPLFFVPSIFVLYLCFLLPLSLMHIAFLFPFFAYLFLSLCFSAFESIKNKDLLAFLLLPYIFFIIHVSYGLGMLFGLVKK